MSTHAVEEECWAGLFVFVLWGREGSLLCHLSKQRSRVRETTPALHIVRSYASPLSENCGPTRNRHAPRSPFTKASSTVANACRKEKYLAEKGHLLHVRACSLTHHITVDAVLNMAFRQARITPAKADTAFSNSVGVATTTILLGKSLNGKHTTQKYESLKGSTMGFRFRLLCESILNTSDTSTHKDALPSTLSPYTPLSCAHSRCARCYSRCFLIHVYLRPGDQKGDRRQEPQHGQQQQNRKKGGRGTGATGHTQVSSSPPHGTRERVLRPRRRCKHYTRRQRATTHGQ